MHRSEYDRLNDVAMRKIGDITSQMESGLLTEEEGTQQAHAVIEEVRRKTAEYQEEKRPSPGSSQFGKVTGLFAVLAAMALALLAYGVFV